MRISAKAFYVVVLFFLLLFFTPVFPVLAAPTINFDSQGTWIINGKRWFFYGTHRIPRPVSRLNNHLDPADWERMVNYYHINNITAGGGTRGDELAEEYGVYLVQGVPWIKDVASWNNAQAKAEIAEQISRPNRIMFFASEENVITSELVFQGYDYLTSTFPDVPSHINFTGMDTKYFPQYRDYIARTKAAVLSSHVGDAAASSMVMSKFRDEIPTLKSTYMLFRMDENPRLEEDIFKSIVAGVNGIKFWEPEGMTTRDAYSGANWGDVIAKVGGYLNEINPGLIAPNRIYRQGYMVSKGTDNRYYIIATPPSFNSFTATGLPPNTQFERLFYGTGTVTTNSSGTLSDSSISKIKIYRQKTNIDPAFTPTPTPSQTITNTPVPTHTPIPTNTPIPTSTIIPTPTLNQNCVCSSNSTCSSQCSFNTIANFTYSPSISCQFNPISFNSLPTEIEKSDWCRRPKRTEGDSNGDGLVSLMDYFYYVAASSQGRIPLTVTSDYNGDGQVNSSDREIIIHTLTN